MNKTTAAISSSLKLDVCSAADLSKYAHKEVTHILSINRPGFPTPTPNWFSGVHRHVFFQDVFSARDAATLNAKAPTASDVREILLVGHDCLLRSKTADTHLLIHCRYGASRSPAAAFAILCLCLGQGREVQAKNLLLRIWPEAVPNILVVAYADKLLRRRGKMVKVIQALYDQLNEELVR